MNCAPCFLMVPMLAGLMLAHNGYYALGLIVAGAGVLLAIWTAATAKGACGMAQPEVEQEERFQQQVPTGIKVP